MIVITAPTGNIGKKLVSDLLSKGESLRLVVRDPSAIPPELRARVDIVEGSHRDLAVVMKAFKGADTVFWLVPPNPKAESVEAAYVEFSQAACKALKSEGVERVVTISALGRGTPMAAQAGLVTASLAMTDMIAGTGVNLRALAMPSFMDNLINQVGAIKGQGMFFSPLSSDRKFPSCATKDIAAAAAKLLCDKTWTSVAEVPLLGPQDLSFNDMAKILSDVVGSTVSFKQIPMEAFAERLNSAGMSAPMVQGYVDMMTAKNQGLDNAQMRTNDSATATGFQEWATDILKPMILG